MSVNIVPAGVADLPDIADIADAAFKHNRIIGHLMPKVPLEVKKAYDVEWYRRQIDMSKLNGLRLYKAVDENGLVDLSSASFKFYKPVCRMWCMASCSLRKTDLECFLEFFLILLLTVMTGR